MAKYWSKSTTSFWDSAIVAVAQMPSDKVAITDAEYADLMSKQANGYRIVHNTSTGKPQAVAQSLTDATRTVQALDSEVVHKTGAETVAGKKTFSDSPKVERVNPYLDIVQTDITKGTAPSATSYAGVRFGGSEGADADDKQMGALLHNYYANGANIMRLQVTKPEAGSTETASMAVAYGADGVPYATAPTPANEADNSDKIATTKWVNKAAEKKLSLTGGTMTGSIVFDGTDVGAIWGDGKDVCVGRSTEGSILRLRGHDTDDNAGGFHIRAMDAEGNYWYLIGYADGKLTWGSHDVITAYGGTMEGKLNFLDDGAVWSDGTDLLVGDASGSLLRLRNLDNPELPGVFQLRASNGSDKNVYLVGNSDGTLTWNAKAVTLAGDCLPIGGGTMRGAINFANNAEQKISVDSGGDLLLGDSNVGALLRVRGNNSDSDPGGFQFRAQDTSTSQYLIGRPNGGLTWGGKNIVRSVNGVNADAAGNVNAISTLMPDYSAGVRFTISSNGYYAPSDGYVMGDFNSDGTNSYPLYINGKYVGRENNEGNAICYPVSKGDRIAVSGGTFSHGNYFYPVKGA